MSLISLSPRRLSNVHSNHNPHHWLTPLSISVKYKSLEKTILGQVYGKVLSVLCNPIIVSTPLVVVAKISVLSSGSLTSLYPLFSFQHSEAYLPGHSQKLFQAGSFVTFFNPAKFHF